MTCSSFCSCSLRSFSSSLFYCTSSKSESVFSEVTIGSDFLPSSFYLPPSLDDYVSTPIMFTKSTSHNFFCLSNIIWSVKYRNFWRITSMRISSLNFLRPRRHARPSCYQVIALSAFSILLLFFSGFSAEPPSASGP